MEMASTIHDLCSDIWENIFQFLELKDLFTTFACLTVAADQVLFNSNNHFALRGLILDADIQEIPKQFIFNRVISLTLHETFCFQIIEQCFKLRSLKLIGEVQWVTGIIKSICQKDTKLDHLSIYTPKIRSLSELLTVVVSLSSLRRVAIDTKEIVESSRDYTLSLAPNKIEQLIIISGSRTDWNDVFFYLPSFVSIRLLSIGLFDRGPKSIPPLISQNIHTLCLHLLETSFNYIIQLVAAMPCFVKLKLNGLLGDDDGFVVNQRWTCLFQSSLSLLRIFVRVSLEQGTEHYNCEKIQAPLNALNLSLVRDVDDDDDFNFDCGHVNRWWFLKGIIIRQ